MELWKDIAGWQGIYQVSSHGRVKSMARRIPWFGNRTRLFPEHIMHLHLQANGYLQLHLKRGRGTRVKRYVHRLVAQAFIENPEEKPVVNHIDQNRENNNVINLEWTTSLENNYYTQACIRRDKQKQVEQCG